MKTRKKNLWRWLWATAAIALALGVVEGAEPWKRLAAEHRARELADAGLEVERGRLEEELARAEAELERRRFELEGSASIEQVEKEIAEWRLAIARAEARSRELEARYANDCSGAEPAPGCSELRGEMVSTRAEIEGYREYRTSAERRLEESRAPLEAALELRDELAAELGALEARLDELEGWGLPPWLAPWDPTLEPLEARPDGLTEPHALAEVQRVDRCATCHRGAHPRPELFVADGSTHPHRDFGCTVCHGGAGRTTDFWAAGHVPASDDEAAAWRERWGRERPARAGAILPAARAEAGCLPCHAGEGRIPRSRTAQAGAELVRRLGCQGCHDVDHPAFRGLPAVGPTLARLPLRSTRAWVYRFLEDPQALRPATFHPRLFAEGEGQAARRHAELKAIVSFLWSGAEPSAPSEVPASSAVPEGDPELGAGLFSTLGCEACHRLDPERETPLARAGHRFHGPVLGDAGDRLHPAWIYTWLLDPRSHRADTPMPDLRLSGEEAAHLTAFLASLVSSAPPAEPTPGPEASGSGEVRDALLLAHLRRDSTLEAADARFERLGSEERDVVLGEHLVAELGCAGCHELAGEGAPEPTAGALAPAIAEMHSSGNAVFFPSPELERTRPPLGPPPARHPSYPLNETEAEAATAFLLGLGAPPVPPDRHAGSTAELAAGRRSISIYGCRGCHRTEGAGGRASEIPTIPELDPIGQRARADWLFAYLEDPGATRLRPWIETRMPTFPLGETEANQLVRYLVAIGGGPLWSQEPEPPEPRQVAVGAAVTGLLQCGRCHPAGEAPDGLAPNELGPPLGLARERLRPDWVVEWILDPESLVPGTAMPVSFPKNAAGEPDAAFVADALETPMFDTSHQRLTRLFEDEDDLDAHLANARWLAEAMRAHIWQLEEPKR